MHCLTIYYFKFQASYSCASPPSFCSNVTPAFGLLYCLFSSFSLFYCLTVHPCTHQHYSCQYAAEVTAVSVTFISLQQSIEIANIHCYIYTSYSTLTNLNFRKSQLIEKLFGNGCMYFIHFNILQVTFSLQKYLTTHTGTGKATGYCYPHSIFLVFLIVH